MSHSEAVWVWYVVDLTISSSQTQNFTIYCNTILWEAKMLLGFFWFPKIQFLHWLSSLLLSLFYLKLCCYRASREWELIVSLGSIVFSGKVLTGISAADSQRATKSWTLFCDWDDEYSCANSRARAASLSCLLGTPGLLSLILVLVFPEARGQLLLSESGVLSDHPRDDLQLALCRQLWPASPPATAGIR